MSFGLHHFKPLILGAVAGLFALPALADPPGRVGRLSDMAGIVSFHDQGDEQWSPAALNYPVTAGNSFWTEPESRAEIHVGSTAIHLDAATELDVTALDDQSFEATLPQGTINIRVLHFNNRDGYNITTPRGVVTLASPGTYRISAGTDSDPTRVAVLDGAAQVVDPSSTVSLTRGEEALLTGTDAIEYEIAEAQPTPFDNASLARERREDEQARAAIRYVSPEMTGYQDLDDHGSWRDEPSYGAVWYPQAVPADWAPYRYGHWRWVEPWGWTWIDDQPWGFAPFHYGRWAYIGNRWGWTPGTIVARPVYAPALVAFIGGVNWSLSLSRRDEPAIGWFPLGPREVYVPSYRASVTYVRNVNVTNVTNVTNITNQTINNASGANAANVRHANQQFATVVPQTAFVSARPVAQAAIRVPNNAVATAPVATTPPITPAAAAASGHQEAVTRATNLARAQGQRLTPEQTAISLPPPSAAAASRSAPGPRIGPNQSAARTGQDSARQPGLAAPAATAPNTAAPVRAQSQSQSQPPVAAAPAPIWAPRGTSGAPAGQAAPAPVNAASPDTARGNSPPAAAPGPPIASRQGRTIGPAGPTGSAPPNAARPETARGGPPPAAQPGSPAASPAVTGTPPAGRAASVPPNAAGPETARGAAAPPAAAPGPPIRSPGPPVGQGNQAKLAPPSSVPPTDARPPGAAAGIPPNRGARTAPAEAAPAPPPTPPSQTATIPAAPPRPPVQPSPPQAAPRAPVAPPPAAPVAARPVAPPAAAPPRAAPAPAAVAARPPAPPERPVARPAQQTVLQPTQQGWTRAAAPAAAPPHPTPAPQAAPGKAAPAAAASPPQRGKAPPTNPQNQKTPKE